MSDLGERTRGSITQVLIVASAIHFSRIIGNLPDVVIGMPIHNRNNDQKRTVGMFSSGCR